MNQKELLRIAGRKVIVMGLAVVMLIGTAACGKKEEAKPEVELSTIVDAVKEAYGEDYVPDTDVDSELLASTYGITEDMYDEYYAQIPMINVNIDTLIAVKCKDGKQQEVVDALTKYQDYIKNDTLQYPTNSVKVQASKIIEKDGYVFFVMLGSIPMDVEEQGDEAILKKAEENNDIAQQVIDSYF
ncbi:MAG: DUF4358 domain-containing protein [Lachnospiraceae bacterium]|nr:DUF4358 domain-containing protein [Lachnospiraceae bacterium]